jgi:hypothetical protein
MRTPATLLAVFLLALSTAAAAKVNYGLRLVGRAVPGEATASFVVSNRLYLGAGDCLQVYDTTNPAAPSIIGQLALPGMVQDVVVANGLAYVADGAGGLVVADVASPTAMAILGQVAVPDEAFGICVQGNYAYVAALTGGFLTIDISNPSAPSLLGSFPVDWSALNVAVQGSLACVASAYGGLYLLDVSNPAAPAYLGVLDQTGVWAYDVKINGNYAYMAFSEESGGGGLAVVDISNPAAPQRSGDVGISWAVRRIDTNGGWVFGAAEDGGLVIFDANTPSFPYVIGQSQARYGNNISFAGNRAYLCGGQDGLGVFSLVQYWNPTLLSSYATYSASQDVAVSGPWAYVVEQPSGLKAINIANAAVPRVTYSNQFYYQAPRYRGVSSGVSVAGDRLYVSDFADLDGGQHDFRAYGLADPGTPQLLGMFQNLEAGVRGHRVRGTIAYLSNSWQLKVLDISDPANMTSLYDLVGGWDFAYGMDLAGDYLYLGTMVTGLRVLSLADPKYPTVVGSFDTAGQTFTAKYYAGYAYLPDYDQGLRIVNVQNPASPYEVGSFSSTGRCLDVAFVAGALGPAAVVAFEDQVVALDIRDPAQPVEIGYYTTGDPRRLCVAGNTIYVADRMSGLWMFVLDGAASTVEEVASGGPGLLAALRSYPNPTERATNLEFDLSTSGPVTVEVYDMGGRKVADVFTGDLAAGTNRFTWGGRDSEDQEVAAGVYLYRVTASGKAKTGRVTILR